MIILDTNVISEIPRDSANPNVIAWFDRQSLSTLWLTSITVAEMNYGTALMPEGKKRRATEQLNEVYVDEFFKDRIAHFDLDCARYFALQAAKAKAQGLEVRGFADAAIAAIAWSKGFKVATRDVAPFKAMECDVINPWDEP